jgi:hypothetical protein
MAGPIGLALARRCDDLIYEWARTRCIRRGASGRGSSRRRPAEAGAAIPIGSRHRATSFASFRAGGGAMFMIQPFGGSD